MVSVVQVIRAARPDVLVLAGVDWDLERHTIRALADAIGGYPHHFAERPNRGIDSGADLNGDGRLGGGEDAHGYAEYAGQSALAILSRLPIDRTEVRDFSQMAWADLPGNLASPLDPPGRRLSTTAHWSVPVIMPDGQALHLLTWHATPPVFDGPEDRNGRRNRDETALWLSLLEGALGPVPERFVLMGGANLDPVDGDGVPDALLSLLSHADVQDPKPTSLGGSIAAAADGGANLRHLGDPRLDTVDWPDDGRGPGNLRVDYVLPSAGLTVVASGVFWPLADHSLSGDVVRASRHRLVWVDLSIGPKAPGQSGERIGSGMHGQ